MNESFVTPVDFKGFAKVSDCSAVVVSGGPLCQKAHAKIIGQKSNAVLLI